MILYEKDWDKYPSAIVHYETKNKTFLEYCSLLKKGFNVKNYEWPLALLNPNLKYVDPHADDLSMEEMIMVSVECQLNPFYFLREVFRVPAQAGSKTRQFKANRANMVIWWCFLNHIDTFNIQCRQTGKTLNMLSVAGWYLMFGTNDAEAILFTKRDLIQSHIKLLKDIRKALPYYLMDVRKNDSDNLGEFTNVATGNKLITYVAQPTDDGAKNVGRGKTCPFTLTDEVPSLKNVHKSLPVMLAGTREARNIAREANAPYGNILAGNCGILDEDEGKFAYNLLTDGTFFKEPYFDCLNYDELYRTLRSHCKSDAILINATYSHRQLGYSDQWLKLSIQESRQTPDQYARDYLLKWGRGNSNNPIEKSLLEQINESAMDEDYLERFRKEGYTCKWYYPEAYVKEHFKTKKIIMGMDTSQAINRDSIRGYFLDISTLEVLGGFGISETNLHGFSMWLARFLAHYSGIILVPEAKDTWSGIRDFLLTALPTMGVDPGRRIYSRIVDNRHNSERDSLLYQEYTTRVMEPGHYNKSHYRTQFGFSTNSALRELLYKTVLQEACKKTAQVIRDKDLIDELNALVVKNDRVDHLTGKHDDCVIAWLLAHWFLTYAKNLDHYGIDITQVKKKLLENKVNLSYMEKERIKEQEEIKLKIDNILEKIENCTDNYVRPRYEQQLNILYNQLDLDLLGDEIHNIDAMVAQSKEVRKIKRNSKDRTAYNDFINRYESGKNTFIRR